MFTVVGMEEEEGMEDEEVGGGEVGCGYDFLIGVNYFRSGNKNSTFTSTRYIRRNWDSFPWCTC